MKIRQKEFIMRIIVLLTLLVSAFAAAQTEPRTRYKDYLFIPGYSDPQTETVVREILPQKLNFFPPWRKLQRVNAVEIKDDITWAAYEVGVKESSKEDFYAHINKIQAKEYRLLKKYERMNWKSVSILNKESKVAHIGYKRADNDLAEIWSPGFFWGSAFGCIDEKPLYKVNLIEGKSPSVAVITAMRDGVGANFIGNSFIRLSIYNGETGELQVDEYPLLWSVMTLKKDKQIYHHMYHYGIWNKQYGIDWRIVDDVAYQQNSLYQMEEEMYSWIDSNWNLAAGRYQYTKLFANDYDNDNRLELLFWHKRYRVKDKNSSSGFFLEKEYFTLYKENSEQNGFTKSVLEYEKGAALLERSQQDWGDGWPQSDQLCDKNDKFKNFERGSVGLTSGKLE